MKLKNSLRRLIKAKLLSLDAKTVDIQSNSILEELLRDKRFKCAKSVGLFMSMPNTEVDTFKIIKYCMNDGKSVFLPRCFHTEEGDSEMEFLKMSSMKEIANLKPQGKYQLREPSADKRNLFDERELDVMILPGVAFTSSGDRLGHGAGFYDKFLSSHLAYFGSSPYLIGIGLREQLVDSIPTEDHDWRMDRVIIGRV